MNIKNLSKKHWLIVIGSLILTALFIYLFIYLANNINNYNNSLSTWEKLLVGNTDQMQIDQLNELITNIKTERFKTTLSLVFVIAIYLSYIAFAVFNTLKTPKKTTEVQ